jgi:hypothetical protein
MVRNTLNRVLHGDFGFTGRLQKNPLHPYWNTTWFNNDPYSLQELIDWAMRQEFNIDSHYEPDPVSRHMTVFDNLRKYAYRHNRNLTYDDLKSQASYLNSKCPEFPTRIKYPMDIREVLSITSSIWRFMQTRYTGRGGSSQYTDDHRKKSAETRIDKKWRNIHLFLEYRKMKLSLGQIAGLLHVTLKTIKNYKTIAASPSSPDSPNPSNPTNSSTTKSSSCHSYGGNTGYAKQDGLANRPLPSQYSWITNTVFHAFSGIGLRLAPNTS